MLFLESTVGCIVIDRSQNRRTQHRIFLRSLMKKVIKWKRKWGQSLNKQTSVCLNVFGAEINLPSIDPNTCRKSTKSPTKSCSLDPWPTFLVLEFLDIFITPITSIINASLAQGTCPNFFNQAHVTPILKKSSLDKEVFKNYRPVSNLNFVSKILERVVAA